MTPVREVAREDSTLTNSTWEVIKSAREYFSRKDIDILLWQTKTSSPGVRFTKVFRTELGHKYILVECSVIALC